LAALLLTELVTNAAAVAITVPIAVASAQEIGSDPRAFALAAITAASASFLTPIGYQTNTMVYGPGRYHFTDYLRLGVPLTLAVVLIVPLLAT
jgi:di/tricarboxylate transporter